MERIAVRELRNQASKVVGRARAGERMIITVDGVPSAEIGPISGTAPKSIQELVAAGVVLAPRVRAAPSSPNPARVPSGRASSDVLDQLRGR